MKYMHLNSSCPYAGLANMLLLHGYDTEDFQIALDIDLPSHIRYDSASNAFLSGFSLQSKKWFDLYLNPRGFTYTEELVQKNDVAQILSPGVMLGILVAPGRKHAVVCKSADEAGVTFINNKRAHTEEPETLSLTRAELPSRLPDVVVVGSLRRCVPRPAEPEPEYEESLKTWEFLRDRLHDFMEQPQPAEALRGQLDPLFRPLLLDGLTMAQLRGDRELTDGLTTLQTDLLNVLRQNTPARLSDHMDMALLDHSIQLILQHGADVCEQLSKNAR